MADNIDERTAALKPQPPLVPMAVLKDMWPTVTALSQMFGIELAEPEWDDRTIIDFPADAWSVVESVQAALQELGESPMDIPPGPEWDDTESRVVLGQLASLAKDKSFTRALGTPPRDARPAPMQAPVRPAPMADDEEDIDTLLASRV
jgi:hypothetical protein